MMRRSLLTLERLAVLVVCWEAKPQTQGEAEFQRCHSHGIKMNGTSRSCAAQWPWEARVERGIEEDDEMEAVSTGNFTWKWWVQSAPEYNVLRLVHAWPLQLMALYLWSLDPYKYRNYDVEDLYLCNTVSSHSGISFPSPLSVSYTISFLSWHFHLCSFLL